MSERHLRLAPAVERSMCSAMACSSFATHYAGDDLAKPVEERPEFCLPCALHWTGPKQAPEEVR